MAKWDCDNPLVAYRNSFEQIKRRYAEDVEFFKKTGRWPDWLLKAIEKERA